jgi:hypothetical protein
MTVEDNIIKMPDRLERRAQKIEAAMARRAKGDSEWVEATLELAVELAGARADHGNDNNAFGRWLNERFGNRAPSHQDRAALIRWGKDPAQTRIMLENRETNSIRQIDEGFTNPGKTPSFQPPVTKPRINEVEIVAATIKAETGKWPDSKTLAQVTGKSTRAADNALRTVKAVEEAVTVPSEVRYTKAQEYHLDARLKARTRQLEADFNERVRLAMLEHNKEYRKGLEELQQKAREQINLHEKLNNHFRPIFTEIEFMTIMTCLHPDNSASKEKRDTAFKAFNAVKFQLTGKK